MIYTLSEFSVQAGGNQETERAISQMILTLGRLT